MNKFNPKDYEEKWISKWEETQVYKTKEPQSNEDKYYCLDMFPYPSGSGLHVGHPHGYLGSDVVARYMRMKGKAVLHPMGFDSFGLPAENYAIKTGTPPAITTKEAIDMFKSQIRHIGLSYDWTKELATHQPEYYKWTQWLFLFLYKKGLAYRKKAPVNWCPKDQTVLANEQVVNGKCERCDSEVIQKDMEQWFFKITDYSDELIEGLKRIDWPESTKLGQINWIGKSEGANITFEIKEENSSTVDNIAVFSTAFDTIFGATFMVIAPENQFFKRNKDKITNFDEIQKYIDLASRKTDLQRQQEKDKTGVKVEGLNAINPMTKKAIPIFIADYVLNTYGTGSVMGVPGHDERDYEFAQKYNIEIIFVTETDEFISYTDEIKGNPEKYVITNSDSFNGQNYKDARVNILKALIDNGVAEYKVQYRLRDWLVSRQRYWGAPIPIVYDPEGNEHPLKEEDLPLILPTDVDFLPTGESPVASSESFKKLAEEKYGKGWHFEADTMDTFVDSSWYFLRYPDVNNNKEFASKEAMNKWMPVDLYIGGAEHTVLHLLYSRFFTKVLHDEGYLNFDEPFLKLRHQGTILASDGRKMSKRWGNVINPDDEIANYGADTLRVYEMFMGPFNDSKAWNTKGEVGVFRFLSKLWDLQTKIKDSNGNDKQIKELNKLIKKVTEDIESLSFNTAVAKLMEMVNFLQKEETISKEVWQKLLIILAPFAPFVTEELWSILGNEYSIHNQLWPEYDENLTKEDIVNMAIQINGKVRGTIQTSPDATEEEVLEMAKKDGNVSKYLTTEIKKVIYVQGRILNIIV